MLVLRALGLGDLLTAVPALRGLRRAFPAASTLLAAPAPLRELAALTGVVDELVPTDGLGALSWAGPPPALAVNLHGSGPESITDLVGTRPGTLLTHRHPDVPDVGGPPWQADTHEVDRWCALLEHAGIAADPADLGLAEPDVPSPCPGAVVLHPGAASPARRWPAERFAWVAAALAAAGHRVVVTGGPDERPLAREVARRAGLPGSWVVAGRTGLSELAALVARAGLVLCGDTGVAHLATAYGTPSVLLFGPTPPSLWGPARPGHRHVTLWSGRRGDPHARRADPGLLELGVDDVLAAVTTQLDRHAARGGTDHG
ncbi:glycosyltransferase family 9 protein [Pseudonocardia sp. KRD-291]|nr:glycosyltransferase family 9 protein [Pseudonocardia sp. KRD291]